MSIFDGLLNPAAIGQNALEAFEHGRRQREERDVRGALSAYAVNPDDPAAFAQLAQYRPEMAIQLQETQRKRQQQAEVQRLTAAAAQGDKAALAQLAGIDLDAWDKLSDNERQAAKQHTEIVGQAALMADTPEEWDNQIARLSEMGIDATQYRGRFDLREAALAKAGLAKEFFDRVEPKYQAVPEGGTLVNVNDPNAVRSFATGAGESSIPTVASPDDARKLAPGSQFRTPDGRVMRVPGGPTPKASGTFQPVGLAGERVTSTMRSAARNRAVGGVKNSYHLTGQARDSVPPPGMSMAAYAAELRRRNPHLDVINEGDHVHMEPKG